MNTYLTTTRDIILSLEANIATTIIWQNELTRKLMIALFSGGHVLLEWVPWLGKTKTVKTLAALLWYDFKRISFTPDLLPSDLTGVEIYRQTTGKFEIRKWPIFSNILLADEINRTPPKVQSALLEAMEESQITIGNETFALPSPFFVIATQNPLEHEGTYPLPEAELDRFFMKIALTYPDTLDEQKILMQEHNSIESEKTNSHLSPKELLEIRQYIKSNIHIDEKIYVYIADILSATRSPVNAKIEYWASTRAGIALRDGARVTALLAGRDYVTPDDIKYIALDVLRHRIGRTYEALAEKISTDEIVTEILESVKIP